MTYSIILVTLKSILIIFLLLLFERNVDRIRRFLTVESTRFKTSSRGKPETGVDLTLVPLAGLIDQSTKDQGDRCHQLYLLFSNINKKSELRLKIKLFPGLVIK